jgi:hypothetical protein
MKESAIAALEQVRNEQRSIRDAAPAPEQHTPRGRDVVKRDVVGALRFLVLPTAALVLVGAGAPGRLELGARIYALLVCGVALVVLVRAVRRADPPETPLRDPAGSTDRGRRPPPSLARLEQLAALGVASSFDLQYRLLPPLRSIAGGILASRRRVELDRDPEAARRILGDETWELVRPARPAPQDRVSRGIDPTELTRAVESLERV